ncbi:hypothetical protein F511_40761 [Dorcoceras hygrometricum]|uniref:Mucin-2-like n=1 Tax=Dorcoceras hygrometricum TaxID=472368 RepID=A0A2Z7CYV6_9LAMI|nr:hypothetical protein F511_40761 [Dorcoceras hygrometricum]
MATSLISNSHHIDFDVVFGMEDTDLVQMFESLIATGLKNFLGCPAAFNEAALTEFFANSSVREDGLVVSTVNGVTVEISKEVFAATFELPVEGLTDLSEVPKNLVFDARSLLSISKEQPCTATTSQIIDLLSVAHSKSLEVLLTQQKEHGLLLEKSCSSIFFDDSIGSAVVLAQFFSLAKSTCWIRPMVQIDGVWTPIQGPDFWKSSCQVRLV